MFSSVSPKILFLNAILIVLATFVSGCEGDCPVGITNALIGNYSAPLNLVFAQIVSFIRESSPGIQF